MRVWMALACVGLLAACANDTGIDNTPAEVAAAAYVAPGPRSITLMTMINNRTGSGGHTALLVNGSQQVIFDPAGSFRDPRVIERGDAGDGDSFTDNDGVAGLEVDFHYQIDATGSQYEDAK